MVSSISINLLVGCHVSCVLIGYATSRLLVIEPIQVATIKTMAPNSHFPEVSNDFLNDLLDNFVPEKKNKKQTN